uniref:C-type lectin domain-containing protein n=1 Tax=Steinernema glaseri TaxID=37863 RepID=A0A1I7YSH6_9BILA
MPPYIYFIFSALAISATTGCPKQFLTAANRCFKAVPFLTDQKSASAICQLFGTKLVRFLHPHEVDIVIGEFKKYGASEFWFEVEENHFGKLSVETKRFFTSDSPAALACMALNDEA